jgi:hypothetical protein
MVRILLVPALTPLYLYVNTFRNMCAVPNMAVFCSSLTSWCPGMLLTYFLNDFEIVPVAPIITGITFVIIFHMRCISIVRLLYYIIFSASFYYYYYYYYFYNYLYSFWKLLVYACQIEILEASVCLLFNANVENVLPLDALRRQM